MVGALGGELVGVYLHGSGALGGYVAGRSDLDIAAVCERRLAAEEKRLIATLLSHERLACPATSLEFFLITRDAAQSFEPSSLYELNLDTGRNNHDVRADPSEQPAHWFLLDLAVCRQQGIALYGPLPPT